MIESATWLGVGKQSALGDDAHHLAARKRERLPSCNLCPHRAGRWLNSALASHAPCAGAAQAGSRTRQSTRPRLLQVMAPRLPRRAMFGLLLSRGSLDYANDRHELRRLLAAPVALLLAPASPPNDPRRPSRYLIFLAVRPEPLQDPRDAAQVDEFAHFRTRSAERSSLAQRCARSRQLSRRRVSRPSLFLPFALRCECVVTEGPHADDVSHRVVASTMP